MKTLTEVVQKRMDKLAKYLAIDYITAVDTFSESFAGVLFKSSCDIKVISKEALPIFKKGMSEQYTNLSIDEWLKGRATKDFHAAARLSRK